jgi:hypothetical protein
MSKKFNDESSRAFFDDLLKDKVVGNWDIGGGGKGRGLI